MKLTWFNDTNERDFVYRDNFLEEPYIVEPQCMVLVEYEVPTDCILFIKRWDNHQVLITSFPYTQDS